MAADISREQVEEVRAELRSGRRRWDVADRFGIPVRTVTAIDLGRYVGRPTAPALLAETWTADCMDPDEWTAWQATNRSLSIQSDQAARPCDDCLLGFAAEMRAIGRCNGQPGGDSADEEHEEGHTMDQPTNGHQPTTATSLPAPEAPTRRVAIAVTAPCGSCTHQVVCRIADEVAAVERTQVPVPKLGTGLTMTLSASIECEFFSPVKRTKAAPDGEPRPRREMTEEQRQAARERMLHARAIGVAKKAAQG